MRLLGTTNVLNYLFVLTAFFKEKKVHCFCMTKKLRIDKESPLVTYKLSDSLPDSFIMPLLNTKKLHSEKTLNSSVAHNEKAAIKNCWKIKIRLDDDDIMVINGTIHQTEFVLLNKYMRCKNL